MLDFDIIIPFKNESKYIQRTLMSVLSQSYDLDRVKLIFCDDHSTDDSYEKLSKSFSFFGIRDFKQNNLVCVENDEESYNSTRIYVEMMKHARNNSIVVCLDGGDWLCDMDTLRIVADTYEQTNCDVLWTNHRFDYNPSLNLSGPMSNKADVYEHKWVSSHLKTFKKYLYDKVPLSNLKDDNGNWIRWARDQALYLPILHLAQKKTYLPICSYHYVWGNEARKSPEEIEKNKQQLQTETMIRSRGFIE